MTRNRSGLWEAIVLQLLGLLIFVLLFNFIFFNLGNLFGNTGRILLGMLFSLVPALLWLGVFYRLDSREPEPKQMVANVFILGGLIMAAIYRPVLQEFFAVDEWLYSSASARFFGGVLVVGFIEQFIVYLAVRYAVFDHPEFNERIDGVIYGVAAGLGVATVINFIYIFERGGIDLDIGSIRVVVNALAYGSLAGVLGYFIGQSRFEKTPIYYMPAGLTLAALLHGIFFGVLGRTSRGFNVHPWGDLWAAAILSALLLAFVFWLVNRANEETLRLARSGASGTWGVPEEVRSMTPANSVASTPTPIQPAVVQPEGAQ